MKEIIDGVSWPKVPQANTIRKKALKKAIRRFGNYTNLAREMGKHKQYLYKLVWKELKPGQDLCGRYVSEHMENVTGIKGLAVELCPSLKKIKK